MDIRKRSHHDQEEMMITRPQYSRDPYPCKRIDIDAHAMPLLKLVPTLCTSDSVGAVALGPRTTHSRPIGLSIDSQPAAGRSYGFDFIGSFLPSCAAPGAAHVSKTPIFLFEVIDLTSLLKHRGQAFIATKTSQDFLRGVLIEHFPLDREAKKKTYQKIPTSN